MRAAYAPTVIVHINHIAPSKKKVAGGSPVSPLAGLVNGAMLSMVEDGVLDARLAPSLRVHLDWIQYKTNFRDPIMVRRTADSAGRPLPLAEPRPGKTRRVAGHVGERRAAARGGRPGRLRRPLRAVPVSPRHQDHDSVHHAACVNV
ncbi:MAG TPA: hypothetical protein VFO31_04660 [Vicinamibacterales bacterium]|nr:hypothetical protein [Vicinamibacterales bacterium]